jgi:O-antigen/teichoic acid export membrane protein
VLARVIGTPLSRAVAGSLGSGVFAQAALAVSGILLARTLGPENRGYLALLLLWPAILSQVGGLGLPFATAYFVARDQAHAAALTRSLMAPAALQTVVLLGCQVAVLLWYDAGKPRPVELASLFTLIAVPAYLAQDYGLGILQGRQRFLTFNLLRAAAPLLTSLAAAVLFFSHTRDLPTVTLAFMIATALGGGAALLVALIGVSGRRAASSDDSVPGRRQLLTFGVRGLLGSIYPVETFRVDQAVVGLLLSPAALGVYVVALAFTNLPRFIAQSVGMVAYPHIAGAADLQSARRSMWRLFWLVIGLSIAAVIPLEAAVGLLVPLFFGSAFAGGVTAARILLVGVVFLAGRRLLAEALKGTGFPMAGTVSEIASWLWLAPALALLIPRGIEGVAVAMTSSAVFSLIVVLGLDLFRERGARHSTLARLEARSS